ncbi:MAG TPA: hypothetical protein PKO33_05435 [Pyrinomonadaceae bacterium]|nr:hypothetical protein [Pyrinomonadaceae bacterium]
MTRILIIVAAVFLLSPAAIAQVEGNPENYCRNGLFAAENGPFSIAVVTKGRANFFSDDRDCPNGKNCRLRSYLISGDEVIVARQRDGFACVWYQPKKGSETVGWIEASRLRVRTDDASSGSWVGNWTYYDNSIAIGAGSKTGEFVVKGTAIWKGLGDNVHVGELDGKASISDTELLYGFEDPPEDCRVTFRKAGNFLIVSDNMNCGGANVTFTGIYKRSK